MLDHIFLIIVIISAHSGLYGHNILDDRKPQNGWDDRKNIYIYVYMDDSSNLTKKKSMDAMDHLRWMFLKISSHFDVPVIPTAWWMIIEGGLTYTPWKTTGDDRWYTKPAQSYFFPNRTS